MALYISPELWLAIIVFLTQQMEALFRDLNAMTDDEREEWRLKQSAEYDDHMAWLKEKLGIDNE